MGFILCRSGNGSGRSKLRPRFCLKVPVQIGGVTVYPGDLLRGDADGVVVIPKAFQEQVLGYAEEITRKENTVRAAIRSNMRMDEARRQNQYHALQSPGYKEVGV